MELKKPSTKWKLVAIAVLITLTIAIAVITNQQAPAQPISLEPTNQPTTQEEPPRQPQTIQEDVRVHRGGYSPSTIEAHQGDNLTLQLRSTDGLEHSYTIAELEINQRVYPDRTTTLHIPTNQPGTYRVYSTASTHGNTARMRGELTIHE